MTSEVILAISSGAIQPERTGTPFRFKFILEYAVPVHLCINSYKIGYFSKKFHDFLKIFDCCVPVQISFEWHHWRFLQRDHRMNLGFHVDLMKSRFDSREKSEA